MKYNLFSLRSKLSSGFLILAAIVVLGFALRLYGLDQNSLYGDELTLVYDTYSILKTGHDQNGIFLPLTFKMAEGRPAGYVYFSIPFVAVLGPSVLAARLLSAFSGVGIIILLFTIGKHLLNEKIGLIAALLAAVSPWDINLSHGGFETHFALLLTLIGVALFLKAKAKPYKLVLSMLFLGLAINTYSTYKLTIPLMMAALVYYAGQYKEWFEKKIVIWSAISAIIILLTGALMVNQALTAGSEGRFLNLNIFNQSKLKDQIIQKINSERDMDSIPKSLSPLFHNKSLEYTFVLFESFVNNFSPEFLFWHGDGNPRHNGSTMGELYPIEIVFTGIGLFYLFVRQRRRLKLVLPWLLIAPLPAALLNEPHALRSSLMLPPLILLSASGIYYLWELVGKKKMGWVMWIIGLAFLFQFLIFADRFYFLAPNQFSRFWSYPAKLASEIANGNAGDFNNVILSDRIESIEFAYPVYQQVDPKTVIAQNQNKSFLGKHSFKKFGNVYVGFLPEGEIEKFIKGLQGSTLYIGPVEEEKYLTNYETINGKDGLKALVLRKFN